LKIGKYLVNLWTRVWCLVFFDSQCSAGRTGVDIGASAKLGLLDKFYYLGDMLSVDGDADAAVDDRIQLVGISSGSWYHCFPIRTLYR